MDKLAIGLADESPEVTEVEVAAEPVAETAPAEQPAPTKEAEAQATEAEPQAAAEVAAEAFEFGGKSWQSKEEAEQSWKSWEGRIRAEQERAKSHEQRVNEYWEYVQAVSKENEDLRAATQPKEPEKEAPKVDFDRIGRLMDAAQKQGIDPMSVGIRAYAEMAEAVYSQKLEDRLKAVEAPIHQMEEAKAVSEADRQMFLWAQGLKGGAGESLYPELQSSNLNEPLARTVYRVWKELASEFGAKYAYSAPGFDYAYRLAKDVMPAQAQATIDANRARDAQGRFTSMQADAEAASGITGTNPNPVKPKAQRSETQQMLDELSAIKTVQIGETDLGFYE